MPCNDGHMHVGAPRIDGVEAGISSTEYIGMFRLAEQNGAQAAAIDILYDDTAMYQYPLVVYPGSPVVSRDTEEKLQKYVQSGGTLAITGTVPARYDTGEVCSFLGGVAVGTQDIQKGHVIVVGKNIAQANSEEDALEDIRTFGELMDKAGVVPKVKISCETCKWVHWARRGGGMEEYTQERMLGSAVIQQANGETILFVLNHYPEAHLFHLDFSIPCNKLVCLTEDDDIVVENGSCDIGIDRKNCQIFLVK